MLAYSAKNLWARTSCHWNLKICTYNARSLSSDDRILELEDELERINFDIFEISEARIKGEGCITLNNSGHNLYYKGGNTCHRGVSFMVNKKIAGNVTSFKAVSDRVAQLSIKISGRYHLNIIQTYFPTTSHTDEDVDIVYEDVGNLISNSKAHSNIIMGDFNAKVGLGEPTKSCTGKFGLGTRNSRGNSLINFAERHQLKIMNTFFRKSPNRRWTWISPNTVQRMRLTTSSQTSLIFSQMSLLLTGSTQAVTTAWYGAL